MLGVLVFRVPAFAMAQLDLRVVLFAVLIAVATAFTAVQAHACARECQRRRRTVWLLLAGCSAGAGIWATHFLAIRAYDWGMPLAYDAHFVAVSLLVTVGFATAGFALAIPDGRLQAAAGGALLGTGIVLAHVLGLKAVEIAGTLHRDPLIAVPLHTFAVALACGAMLAGRELAPFARLWAVAALIAATICGLHFAAIAGIAVTSDPGIAVSASALSGSTLTIVVACATALPMVAARACHPAEQPVGARCAARDTAPARGAAAARARARAAESALRDGARQACRTG